MVGVRMRLEDADDPHAVPLRLLEVVLDRVGGINYDRLPGALVADQIGRAAEVVVDELAKQHGPNLARPAARSRGASRSPSAGLRSCPRRFPGSSDRGRGAR